MDYKTIPGVSNSLISAPHTFAYRRPNLALKRSKGDLLTKDLIQEICNTSGIWGIYALKSLSYDPCYHKIEFNEYKEGVRDIVKKQKITRFVDISSFENSNYDIAIYYKSHFKNSKELAQNVRKAIDRGDLDGVNIMIFRTKDGLAESLSDYVSSELKTPGVEVHVSKEILSDPSLRSALVANISEYLAI